MDTPLKYVGCTAVFVLVAGCATVRVPLCPPVAMHSHHDKSASEYVNRYAAKAAKQRGVRIEVVSPVLARLSGMMWKVRAMERDYPDLLCAIEPYVMGDDIYRACIGHAAEWMWLARHEPATLVTSDDFVYSCVIGRRVGN